MEFIAQAATGTEFESRMSHQDFWREAGFLAQLNSARDLTHLAISLIEQRLKDAFYDKAKRGSYCREVCPRVGHVAEDACTDSSLLCARPFQRRCISSGETASITCWSIHSWPKGSRIQPERWP